MEQGHVAKRRDARLCGGRKKVTACAVLRMGLLMLCVFSLIQTTRAVERTGNNYLPQWSAAVNVFLIS